MTNTTRILRTEGILHLGAALAAYFALGGHWGWLLGLFLVPDLTLLGYLAGPRLGAAVYNVGHSHVGPALLAALGLALTAPLLWLGALIWVAHIGFDRALGFGLKRPTGFRDTHLQPIEQPPVRGHVGRRPGHAERARSRVTP